MSDLPMSQTRLEWAGWMAMLEVVANALRSSSRKFIRDGYQNDDGDWDIT
jgi:hypothetical protein